VVQHLIVEGVQTEFDLTAEQFHLSDIFHLMVQFVTQAIHAEIHEVVEAKALTQVAEVDCNFFPIDPHEVLVLNLQWLILDQFLDHVSQFPTGPALLKISIIEFSHRFVMIIVYHFELLLFVGVEVYDGLLGHAEPGGFDFLVGLRHEDVRVKWFVQIRVVSQLISQIGDLVHEQLLHFRFE